MWQTFQECGSSHPRHYSYLTGVWAMGVESPQHCSSCLMVPGCPRTFVSDTLSRMRGSMGLTVVCEKRPALASADKEDLEHSGRDRKWQLSVSSVCPEMTEYHQPGVFHLPLDTVIPARISSAGGLPSSTGHSDPSQRLQRKSQKDSKPHSLLL